MWIRPPLQYNAVRLRWLGAQAFSWMSISTISRQFKIQFKAFRGPAAYWLGQLDQLIKGRLSGSTAYL